MLAWDHSNNKTRYAPKQHRGVLKKFRDLMLKRFNLAAFLRELALDIHQSPKVLPICSRQTRDARTARLLPFSRKKQKRLTGALN